MAKKPFAKKMEVTPALAMQWLEKSPPAGPSLSEETILCLADVIEKGKWIEDTGEAIKLDENENVLDGIHRLWAIFTADVAVNTLVVFNVKPGSLINLSPRRRRTNTLLSY